MISIMFYPTAVKVSPFELVKAGREEDEQKMVQGGGDQQESPHWRFMKVLDAYCLR